MMTSFTVSLPTKWAQYLKRLVDDYQIDLNKVINELCEWAFSNPEGKQQFEAWLADAFPPKGAAEDKRRRINEELSAAEEYAQDVAEEETHENRDYSEDRKLTP